MVKPFLNDSGYKIKFVTKEGFEADFGVFDIVSYLRLIGVYSNVKLLAYVNNKFSAMLFDDVWLELGALTTNNEEIKSAFICDCQARLSEVGILINDEPDFSIKLVTEIGAPVKEVMRNNELTFLDPNGNKLGVDDIKVIIVKQGNLLGSLNPNNIFDDTTMLSDVQVKHYTDYTSVKQMILDHIAITTRADLN